MSWRRGLSQHLQASRGAAGRRAPASVLSSQPALSGPCSAQSSQSKLLSSTMAQLFFHPSVSRQKLPPGTPWFHGGTSISLLSSLNNQNSCPV